jgi:murein L,D-transpeptidase YafK
MWVMRNLKFLKFLLPAALLLAAGMGCGGGLGKPDAGVALEQPQPQYQPQHSHLTPEQKYIAELLNKNGYRKDPGGKPTVLVVHKLSRKLTLYQGITPLKSFPIVLGNDPYNDKLCQGDACTPEGVYRIRAKYPHARWDKFIWLDYPNTQNWLKFSKAKQAGKLPPDADIGGQVGIHGTEDPTRNLSGQNWTKGCVSLMNNDLDELYPLINDKTLVVINKD